MPKNPDAPPVPTTVTQRKPLLATSLPAESGSNYPEPFALRMRASHWHVLGEPFGLTQFGVNLEVLQPGAQSALRHCHTLSDEWVYVLSGALTLCTNDGECSLTAGQCMGFPAGDGNGHHLVNRSAQAASFMVVGSRHPDDLPHYPDDDLERRVIDGQRVWTHKDGRRY